MRWLVLALVAVNIVYGGWHWRLQGKEGVARWVDHSVRNAPALVLLSERPAPAPVMEDAPRPPVQCGWMGPYEKRASAHQIEVQLVELGFAVGLDVREVADRADYWVHIPPLATRQEAVSLLQELQRRGIDSFLITEGELAQGISLGIFASQGSAQGLAARRRAQGYEAEVYELLRRKPEYWVALPAEAMEQLGDEALASLSGLISEGESEGVEVKIAIQPCEALRQPET